MTKAALRRRIAVLEDENERMRKMIQRHEATSVALRNDRSKLIAKLAKVEFDCDVWKNAHADQREQTKQSVLNYEDALALIRSLREQLAEARPAPPHICATTAECTRFRHLWQVTTTGGDVAPPASTSAPSPLEPTPGTAARGEGAPLFGGDAA